jgi:hypothetical protein
LALPWQVILLTPERAFNNEMAPDLNIGWATSTAWRKRFLKDAPPGVIEIPLDWVTRFRPPKEIKTIQVLTLHTKVPEATHRNSRSILKVNGVNTPTVRRLTEPHDQTPHHVWLIQTSRDLSPGEHFTELVGLFVALQERQRRNTFTGRARSKPWTALCQGRDRAPAPWVSTPWLPPSWYKTTTLPR